MVWFSCAKWGRSPPGCSRRHSATTLSTARRIRAPNTFCEPSRKQSSYRIWTPRPACTVLARPGLTVLLRSGAAQALVEVQRLQKYPFFHQILSVGFVKSIFQAIIPGAQACDLSVGARPRGLRVDFRPLQLADIL